MSILGRFLHPDPQRRSAEHGEEGHEPHAVSGKAAETRAWTTTLHEHGGEDKMSDADRKALAAARSGTGSGADDVPVQPRRGATPNAGAVSHRKTSSRTT